MSAGAIPATCPQPLNKTLMINFKKLKRQIHKMLVNHGETVYVFEARPEQMCVSEWQIYTTGAKSKRKLIKHLMSIIHDKDMNHWRKEFIL